MRKWLGLTLVLVLVGALVWGYWERVNTQRVALALEAGYQQQFYDVVRQSEQVEVLLAKSLASNSPQQQIIYLTEIWGRATSAQAALSQLPFKDVNLSASRKFLSQVGDYSYSLAKAAADGRPMNVQQREQLSRFHDEIGKYSQGLHDIQTKMAQGSFRWTDALLRQPVRVARAAGGDLDSFTNLDIKMQEFPSLVYDGPFSDHVQQRQPLGLTGSEIDQNRATQIAGDFIDVQDRAAFRVLGVGEANGKIPAWVVAMQGPGNDMIDVNVCKKGGHVAWMLNSRPVSNVALDAGQALSRAQAFLASKGFEDMEPTYSIQELNYEVITFVAKEKDILIYPDQLKVKVALDDGRVTGFDAVTFLMNHHPRNLEQPKLSAGEAQQKVNAGLKVEKVRKALIPMGLDREVLTYEVKSMLGADPFLIYINAMTGQEEKILQLINQPGGQLAM